VIDQFTRECLALVAGSALNGQQVALALSQVVAERGTPQSITADNVLSLKAIAAREQRTATACGASNLVYGQDAAIATVGSDNLRSASVKGSLAALAGIRRP
jgi:transposase InsO family protein